ncbi:MAG: M15 family metallopeptidase [Clostridia bacterium]|nr:M15 family metallopeptidase [Clostridia bacterium]
MRRMKALIGLILLGALILAGIFLSAKPRQTEAVPAASGRIENRTGIPLVNAANPLQSDAEPQDLVNLYEQKRHFLLARSDIFLTRETFEAANRMFKQAEDEDMNGFILTSGYRSREKQAELYAEQQDGTAQPPGCSEHETGLAFDVTARSGGDFEATPQFQWLSEHCWDYGFILRYPKGKEQITGIAYEPWHYRYVGEEAAKLIRDRGWTLEEYCLALSQ